MNILTRAIRRRVMNRIDAALGVARPAPRTLMSRLAVATVLRLALRWPALSVLVIVSVVAARFIRRPGESIVRAPGQPQLEKVSGPGDQPASL